MSENPNASEGPEFGGQDAARRPRFTLRPVMTPLKPASRSTAPAAGAKAPVRGENEDDDGYDPYSDFHDGTAGAPVFERDPWS